MTSLAALMVLIVALLATIITTTDAFSVVPSSSRVTTTRANTRRSSSDVTRLWADVSEEQSAATTAASSPEEQSAATTAATSSSDLEPGSHDELMYCLGVNLARQLGDVRPLVENGEELAQVAKGLLDAVVGRLDDEAQRNLLQQRGQDLNAMITERANTIRQRLEETGRDMLKQMEETEGVEKLDNGVLLHVLEPGPEGPGKGVRPTQSSSVKVHYHGTLPDGTIFDTTQGGEPVTFALATVIPGWRDGLMHMHEGETAMLGIPPEQAYGADGTPDGRIPGGSTLFFKVQLVEVLTAGVGGGPTLLGADGQKLKKDSGSGGLLGADGKPL